MCCEGRDNPATSNVEYIILVTANILYRIILTGILRNNDQILLQKSDISCENEEEKVLQKIVYSYFAELVDLAIMAIDLDTDYHI